VVSDEPPSVHTFVEYSWRFEIEENCVADKSNGFQLESSLVRTAEAVARLWLVLAVTPLYRVAQGTQVVAGHKRRWVAPQWWRGNSSLRRGWQGVKTALTRGWTRFTPLSVPGAPDPEPARASASQSLPPPPVTFTKTCCYLPT
jgi:hypothetical protein